MKPDRPVNLSLTTIRQPITAIVSITHRITGAALFVGSLLLFWLLGKAVESEAGFAEVKELLSDRWVSFALWITLTALGYHVVAGIRHLLVDFHVGDSLEGGRMGAYATLALSALIAVLAGVWLW